MEAQNYEMNSSGGKNLFNCCKTIYTAHLPSTKP